MAYLAPASEFQIPVDGLRHEVAFYDDAGKVMHDINAVRDRLEAQNEEFSLLMEYYLRNRGRIDVYNQSKFGPLASKPNLGTANESWYYLDNKGNRIWVQNLELQNEPAHNRGKPTGAAMENHTSDPRRVVVKVPNALRSYGFPADYRRRCEDYSAFAHRGYVAPRPSSARMLADPAARLSSHSSGGAQHHLPTAMEDEEDEAETEHYIHQQQELNASLTHRPRAVERGYVTRPPTSYEEAEARLAQLRAEEERIMRQLARS